MSYDKETRALRRKKDRKAISKQVIIGKIHLFSDTRVVGIYRKVKAVNCGKPRCPMCGNPRRIWGHLTLAERRANQHD